MSKKHIKIGLLVLILALTGCKSTKTPDIATEGIFIGELLPGVPGNNDMEFIELYNAGAQVVDLDGWSLSYRADDKQEAEVVYAWEGRADIPAHGHYLLARLGQEIGALGDAEYDTPLFGKKGELMLQNPDGETVDALAWGKGSGSPAPAPKDGASLERRPGGDDGNGANSGDNADDFASNASPTPQNSGSPITPLPDERLVMHLEAPTSVEPGGELVYSVEIQNLSGGPVGDARVLIPIPAEFDVVSLPSGGRQAEGWIEWTVAELADGATEKGIIALQSPWTYLDTMVEGYYVEARGGELHAYGPPLPLAIEGGSIPIATARVLEGKTVTVEGVATMYTGGFYAGGGAKFYLEDETGGIQVYCPDAQGIVVVQVGDQVRVSGKIEVYRDSLEIIPSTYPDDVEITGQGAAWEARPVTLQEAANDEDLLGRLIVAEGVATRIQELSFSYEVDLTDESGVNLVVNIEKETGVTTEPLEVGKSYRVTGISEFYSALWQLKPRLQTDLVEIFPPELMLDMHAPYNALPGETIPYTLTVYNHTAAPLTDVRVEATPPTESASIAEVLDGGQQEGATVVWIIPKLDGGGGSATVRYLATVGGETGGQIVVEGASASAAEWPDAVQTQSLLTFVGGAVPVWAVQGGGSESPYVRNHVTTEGIVIGVFPELLGFWIQGPEPAGGSIIPTRGTPAGGASTGLFVLAEEFEVPLQLGDQVQVRGKVREVSGQTLLQILSLDDVTVLGSGNTLPAAAELDPPQDEAAAQVYLEALEGMLVQVSEPAVAVAPTSKYGETALVRATWEIERVMRGDPIGWLIFVDDGSAATHYDLGTLPFAIQSGDTVADVAGPLAYTFENYKIEPIEAPTITPSDRPLPALQAVGANEFSIATFNVENLFDTQDPNPSDPPRPSVAEYELKLTKTANAILAMGAPTIVGLQEVENIDILADLAEQDVLAEYAYEVALIEGTDSRGIDVGYLVRGDQATIEGAAAFPAPEGLTSRPPLLITTTLHLESGDVTLYVFNNHFTSMSGGEKATELRRTAQAEWNATLVKRILADEPEAFVAVLGDLNSFYDSPPMDALRQSGLRHAYELAAPYRPYTYIYQGESETLDHVWLTESLYARLARADVLHINADYSPAIPGDPSARRVSDHDPLIAVFSFE